MLKNYCFKKIPNLYIEAFLQTLQQQKLCDFLALKRMHAAKNGEWVNDHKEDGKQLYDNVNILIPLSALNKPSVLLNKVNYETN